LRFDQREHSTVPNGRQKESEGVQFDFDAVQDLMRCPRSKSELVFDGSALVSVNPDCRLRYQIRDGIPSMFPDDAIAMEISEWSAVMSRHGRNPQTGEAMSPSR
jgi:uncharacterized protein YbaR (Trm112 family)